MTTSGNVSEHSTGTAVDIAAINGIPIIGHQGPGSITDITIRRLLTLQGTMKPHQIISLMTFAGHRQHAVDGRPQRPHPRRLPPAVRGEHRRLAASSARCCSPGQWSKLIDRLGKIENPTVPTSPSKYSLDVPSPGRASTAHAGD